jgi:hypothetical protein
LNANKELLHNRFDSWLKDKHPGAAPKPESAQAQAAPKEKAAPEKELKPGSLSEEFRRQMTEKEKAKSQPPEVPETPTEEEVDDGFEDDVPWARNETGENVPAAAAAASSDAELDIF